MATNFILFDIDGVLIKPVGYRKAVFDTSEHFLNQLGFSKLSINEETISALESIGITSEWDMLPIYLTVVIELTLKINRHLIKFSNISKFDQFSDLPSNEEIIHLILEIEPYLLDGYSACDSILKMVDAGKFVNLFPNILTNASWVIDNYLKRSRSITHSPILQYFQNLILGSDQLNTYLDSPVLISSESYLLMFDEPLIDTHTKEILDELKEKLLIFPSIITARPSLHPDGDELTNSGNYFPEAELALKRLKMVDFPYIGYGALQSLASIRGGSGDNYVKPIPLHALAAILSSGGVDLLDSLNIAYDYLFNHQKDQVNKFFSNLVKPINISIFEDSAIGIKSLRTSCEKLISDGIEINLSVYGIAENELKKASLKKENAFIFPSINEAFSHYVSTILESSG